MYVGLILSLKSFNNVMFKYCWELHEVNILSKRKVQTKDKLLYGTDT